MFAWSSVRATCQRRATAALSPDGLVVRSSDHFDALHGSCTDAGWTQHHRRRHTSRMAIAAWGWEQGEKAAEAGMGEMAEARPGRSSSHTLEHRHALPAFGDRTAHGRAAPRCWAHVMAHS